MTKTICISEYNLAYTEGNKPVYLQIYLVGEGKVEIGFCLADSPEEALFLGAMKGTVISNVRLIEIFKKLKAVASLQGQLT